MSKNRPHKKSKLDREAIDNEHNDSDEDSSDELSDYDIKHKNTFANNKNNIEKSSELYLETVSRKRLDFDFEKLCSISLSNVNVYACLICGKYFQGRGKSSYAYFHSVDEDHHVFLNFDTLKIYVLPESYQVISNALNDVKYVVNPTYTKEQILKIDKTPQVSYDLDHLPYNPGFVGMNNIHQNDYLNVVVQALAHVPPIRNYFLLNEINNNLNQLEISKRFGILIRKIWNPKAFKGHVSPHELLQQIYLSSEGRYKSTEQADLLDFFTWFLNHLHLALGGSKIKYHSSIIQKTFQGKLLIESQNIHASINKLQDRLTFETDKKIIKKEVPFLFLTLDLPPAPIFQDNEGQTIPQILLTTLLEKYNGNKVQELAGNRKRYKINDLPPYLIFIIKRFSKTAMNILEKNPTIVEFPLKNLDMSPYLNSTENKNKPIYYDLISNIVHESRNPGIQLDTSESTHIWKIQLLDKSRDEWIQIQDLYKDTIPKEMLFLAETYIQIWERKTIE